MRWNTALTLTLGLLFARAAAVPGQAPGAAFGVSDWQLRVAAFKSLQPGLNVRLVGKDLGSKTGHVLATGDSTLILDGPRRIPYAGVDSAWVRRNHATTGFLIGSLIGTVAALGLVHSSNCDSWDVSVCASGTLLKGLAISLGSGLIGAAIGSSAADWKRRYP